MKAKRILCLGLAAAMTAMVFSGCNGNSGSEDTIKVGVNYELSGTVSQYGQSCVEGIEMAVEEINAAGGVLGGKKIEMVKIDNKSDNIEAMNVATRLITQEKVSVIMGPAISGAVQATTAVATAQKVPVITCSATADDITVDKNGELNPYTYRICYTDSFQAGIMSDFAQNDLQVKNVVIISDSTDAYSQGLGDAFKAKFTANGGTVVAEESYQASDKDFSALLTKIKDKEFDAIYLTGYYESVGLMIKQARGMGIDKPFLGADGYDSPKLPTIAGDALNNVFFTNHYSAGDPSGEVKGFIENFKKKYNKDPNGFNALGYDMARYVADAIERAGSADSEKINQALADTKDFPAVTGKFSIDQNHNPVKATVIIEYKDGAQMFRTKIEAK